MTPLVYGICKPYDSAQRPLRQYVYLTPIKPFVSLFHTRDPIYYLQPNGAVPSVALCAYRVYCNIRTPDGVRCAYITIFDGVATLRIQMPNKYFRNSDLRYYVKELLHRPDGEEEIVPISSSFPEDVTTSRLPPAHVDNYICVPAGPHDRLYFYRAGREIGYATAKDFDDLEYESDDKLNLRFDGLPHRVAVSWIVSWVYPVPVDVYDSRYRQIISKFVNFRKDGPSVVKSGRYVPNNYPF